MAYLIADQGFEVLPVRTNCGLKNRPNNAGMLWGSVTQLCACVTAGETANALRLKQSRKFGPSLNSPLSPDVTGQLATEDARNGGVAIVTQLVEAALKWAEAVGSSPTDCH